MPSGKMRMKKMEAIGEREREREKEWSGVER